MIILLQKLNFFVNQLLELLSCFCSDCQNRSKGMETWGYQEDICLVDVLFRQLLSSNLFWLFPKYWQLLQSFRWEATQFGKFAKQMDWNAGMSDAETVRAFFWGKTFIDLKLGTFFTSLAMQRQVGFWCGWSWWSYELYQLFSKLGRLFVIIYQSFVKRNISAELNNWFGSNK